MQKKVIKLVEGSCKKEIDVNDKIYNDYGNVFNSCTIYIALFVIVFLIIIGMKINSLVLKRK